MNVMPSINTVAPPIHPASDFLAHEKECRDAMRPWIESLLDRAEAAGWQRRTVASTLMFLSAQQVSTAGASSDRSA
ncbi:hypothetical protein MesoLjLb_13350 [Mesorhizobium sp. L-8-3]|nr:hypothetical protein MesoLjLb_13350 [Mesorhizobium sp. L-8-3]